MIFTVYRHHDDAGRLIEEHRCDDATQTRFIGTTQIVAVMANGRKIPRALQFPIVSDTLAGAFEVFDAYADGSRQKAVEELNRPRIAVAGAIGA